MYAILGVTQDASESEIKTAYRKSALKYHPDKQASKSEEEKKSAETMFKSIGEAYEILSNSEKKARYDSGIEVEDLENPHARPGGDDMGGGMRGGGGIDPNIFHQMFGGGGGGFGGFGGGGGGFGGFQQDDDDDYGGGYGGGFPGGFPGGGRQGGFPGGFRFG